MSLALLPPPPSLHRRRRHLTCRSRASGASAGVMREVKLKPIDATPETFKEFGQVIEASPDGDEFGPKDAQLDLSRGVPRSVAERRGEYVNRPCFIYPPLAKFYIMHLEDRPLKFSDITHHASVTQCLGSIGGHAWYLGVAKPSIAAPGEVNNKTTKKLKQSQWGHFYVPPAMDNVSVFRISGSKFVKLHHGTWHAGPLFRADKMDFYNLELSNTNVVDHTRHNFVEENGVVFLIDE